mgnify:CR=1 FL=1
MGYLVDRAKKKLEEIREREKESDMQESEQTPPASEGLVDLSTLKSTQWLEISFKAGGNSTVMRAWVDNADYLEMIIADKNHTYVGVSGPDGVERFKAELQARLNSKYPAHIERVYEHSLLLVQAKSVHRAKCGRMVLRKVISRHTGSCWRCRELVKAEKKLVAPDLLQNKKGIMIFDSAKAITRELEGQRIIVEGVVEWTEGHLSRENKKYGIVRLGFNDGSAIEMFVWEKIWLSETEAARRHGLVRALWKEHTLVSVVANVRVRDGRVGLSCLDAQSGSMVSQPDLKERVEQPPPAMALEESSNEAKRLLDIGAIQNDEIKQLNHYDSQPSDSAIETLASHMGEVKPEEMVGMARAIAILASRKGDPSE